MFSWKYQLRLSNLFNCHFCWVIYGKIMTCFHEQGPQLHRVPACWASFLHQPQVNMLPADAVSSNPPSNYTVYDRCVHSFPEDLKLQRCLQFDCTKSWLRLPSCTLRQMLSDATSITICNLSSLYIFICLCDINKDEDLVCECNLSHHTSTSPRTMDVQI